MSNRLGSVSIQENSRLRPFEERYRPKFATEFDRLHGDHTVRYVFAGKFANRAIVLDAGCGYGYGSRFLADCGADYVVGIDKDQKSIRLGKNWYRAKNLDFIVADANHMPLRSNAFDVATSLEVIEHIRNCEDYLRQIQRVLITRGILVLSTPNKYFTDRTHLRPLHHVREFYPSTLRYLLGKHFSVLKLYGKSVRRDSTALSPPAIGAQLRSAIARVGSIELFRALLRTMPNWVLHIIRLSLNTSYVPPFKPEDFEISETSVNTASNLIAVCKKTDN